jgi:putative acetyltransferase
MSAAATPALTLRPFLPTDTPLLAEIFRASVDELTVDDYSDAQRQAWVAAADDEQAWGGRLGKQLTILGLMGGSPVGFASLKGADELDMLYVHPAAIGNGVGSMLVDALEKLAAARGALRLTAEVSDSATEFFQKRGFVPHQRNTVPRGDEWLGNTTMHKQLAAKERPQ